MNKLNIKTCAIILLAQTAKNNLYLFGAYNEEGQACSFIELPEDKEYFVETLRGAQTIMGTKTLAATPIDFPDGGRFCVTHYPKNVRKDAIAVSSIKEGITLAKAQALRRGDGNVYIIGGAEIIKQALVQGLIDEIKLTLTNTYISDIFKPIYLDFDLSKWQIIKDSGKMTSRNSNPKNLSYQFLTIVPKE